MAAVVQTATNGGTGATVVVILGSTPINGNKLVLIINSDTTVPAPTGFTTTRESLVSSQGFYVFEKTAGASEPTTITVDPNGNNPCSVSVIELDASVVGTFDQASTDTESVGVLTSNVIPTVTTVGGDGAFVLAIVALHGLGTAATFGTFAFDNGFANVVTSTLNSPSTGSSTAVQHAVGSKTLAVDGAVGATTGSWTNAAEEAFGVFVVYNLVSSGTNYTGSPSDPVGVTDSATDVVTVARTVADPVGITDSASGSITSMFSQAPADPVGITDSATVVLTVVANVADPVGITDTGGPITLAYDYTLSDPVGVTDTAVDVETMVQSPAEPVGVTDNATDNVDAVRTTSDPVGVTDSATANISSGGTNYTGTPADPVGVTDSASNNVDAVRAPADPVGITDAVLAQLDRVVTVADFLNLTDTAQSAFGPVANLGDPVGITDNMSWTVTAAQSPAESVGITDTLTVTLARVVTIADPVGILDAVTAQTNLQLRDITVSASLANPRWTSQLSDKRWKGSLDGQ